MLVRATSCEDWTVSCTRLLNGADGISDVEGKVARVAMSELGNERISMERIEQMSERINWEANDFQWS